MIRRLALLSVSVMVLIVSSTLAQAHNGDARLSLGSLEVTQSVEIKPQQGLAAETPLTAHKPTTIRAYVKARRWFHLNLGFFNFHFPSFVAVNVNGTLTVKQGAAIIAVLPASNGPISVTPWVSTNPQQANSSLNFNWAFPPVGAVDFDLSLTTSTAGVSAISPAVESRTFTHNERRRIEAVKINYDPDGPGPGPVLASPPAALVANGSDWFLKSGPLAPCKLQYWTNPTPLTWTFNRSVSTASAPALNLDLQARQVQGSIVYDNVYGWWGGSVSGNGYAQLPASCFAANRVASHGNTDATRHQRTFTHELYHNYHQQHLANNNANWACDAHPGADPGPAHPNGEIGLTGWDTALGLPVGPTRLDVMVAGQLTNAAWQSPQRYTQFWNKWADFGPESFFDPCHFDWWEFFPPLEFHPFGPILVEEEILPIVDQILVAGIIQPDGLTGELLPAFRLTRPLAGNQRLQEGTHAVQLFDLAGVMVAEELFTPNFEQDAAQPGPASFSFRMPTPVDPDLGELNLSEIVVIQVGPIPPGPLLVDRILVSATPPVVDFIQLPPPGQPITEPTQIGWKTDDADSDPVTCSMQYSPDNGMHYLGLVGYTNEAVMAVDPNFLPGGKSALFRVMCTDGFHTTEAVAGPFEVPRGTPEVFIREFAGVSDPTGPVMVAADVPVTADGYGSSPDDGVIPPSRLRWLLNDIDPLAIGPSVELIFPAGSHVLSLTTEDRAGVSATAEIPIEAVPLDLDTDGDGTPDIVDDCPTIPGPAHNDGCPFESFEFEIPVEIVVNGPIPPGPLAESELIYESFSDVFAHIMMENPRPQSVQTEMLSLNLTSSSGVVVEVSMPHPMVLLPGESHTETILLSDAFPGQTVDGPYALVAEVLETDSGGAPTPAGRGEAIFAVDSTMSTPVASIIPCDITPAVGSQISTCVEIDMRNGPESLGSYGATLQWNPMYLQFVGFAGGDPPFDTPVFNTDDVAMGIVRFSDADPVGALGRVRVACFEFDVIAPAGTAAVLDLGLTSLFTAETFTDILPVATVNDATLNVDLACTVGDVNGDLAINSGDALLILANEIARVIPASATQAIAAGCGDANGDGLTDSIDANVVLSFEVQLPIDPTFPIGKPNAEFCTCGLTCGLNGVVAGSSSLTTAATPLVDSGGRAEKTRGQIVTSLQTSSRRPSRGEEFEVTVALDMRDSGRKLGSYGAELRWNPKAVRFVGIGGGDSSGLGAPMVNEAEAAKGRLRFATANPYGAAGNVELVRVRFEALRDLRRPTKGFRLNFTSLGSTGPRFENLRPLLRREQGGSKGGW